MEVERNDLEDEIQTIPENGNTSLVDSKTSIVDVTFEEEISTTTDSLVIECSSIRVGSLKGTSLVPVIISTKYIEFKFMIEGERSVHCIKLQSDDILQCLYGQMYGVIFIVTNIEAGIKIRSVLGMKKKVKGKSHLDPGGSVGKGLFVTFFIAFPCNLQNEQLKNVLQCYKNFANEEFLIELDEHSQHKILLETSPNTGQEKKELVILKALTRAASTDFNNNFVSGEATQTAVEMYKFKPEGLGVKDNRLRLGVDYCRFRLGVDDCRLRLSVNDCRFRLGVDDCRFRLGLDDCSFRLGVDDCRLRLCVDDCRFRLGVDYCRFRLGEDDCRVKTWCR
ncbi:Hypothetical predicted protein [Mytilus galloprovincialis]|uniref:Uncharacterized protein n=1 Tax=Mytilus galloprovincialis TaxID=29158 RepID=A0A8B6BG11_MYTGA|nr:Hypothetical predicted protein [Mytilus galloprovincialis]